MHLGQFGGVREHQKLAFALPAWVGGVEGTGGMAQGESPVAGKNVSGGEGHLAQRLGAQTLDLVAE